MVGNQVAGLDRAAQLACIVENLTWAAPQAAAAGVTLLVEPLNATDQPHYFVHNSSQGMEIIQAVNHPNVRLQFDFYHMQMSEGNLTNTFTRLQPFIGHVQISDAPERHQPGTGEINYSTIFALLERLNYGGHIGLEYRPEGETDVSLAWLPFDQRAS